MDCTHEQKGNFSRVGNHKVESNTLKNAMSEIQNFFGRLISQLHKAAESISGLEYMPIEIIQKEKKE